MTKPIRLRLRIPNVKESFYRFVVAASRLLFAALGLRIEVYGRENIPTTGPAVLAANHTSFLDFQIVALPAVQRGRLVRFLGKESVFRSRLGGILMRGMRHIPVDRAYGAMAARQVLEALKGGDVVAIYPEATIGRSFFVKDREHLRRGAAYLALSTGAPLVPVVHFGIHRVWTTERRWSLRRGRAVSIMVGKPLTPRPGEDADALTTRLHERLAAMLEEVLDTYPQAPLDAASAWWWPHRWGGGAPTAEVAHVQDERAVRRETDPPSRLAG